MQNAASPVTEKVALGYLELGIAGAILLTVIIIGVVIIRWASKQRELERVEIGKQRELDRRQFSEQLAAERDDGRDERTQHLDEQKAIAESHKQVAEKIGDAMTEQTGTFHAIVTEQRQDMAARTKDFTGAIQKLTTDQIELAKLKARADSKKDGGGD